MTDSIDNAFEAPKADLSEISNEQPILQFERKSAWLVFFLSLITFGIYVIYWLYTRIPVANQAINSENKVNINLLNGYIALYILSMVLTFTAGEDNTTLILIGSGISIASTVTYLVLIFSFRSTLREIINYGNSDAEYTNVNGIITFFGSAIYFQYKINQATDKINQQVSTTIE